MKRIFLGKAEHWAVLAVFAAALHAMGGRHLHVRAFVPFSLGLLALVALGLAFIVWRHRPGDVITREPMDEAALPHAGGEEDAPDPQNSLASPSAAG